MVSLRPPFAIPLIIVSLLLAGCGSSKPSSPEATATTQPAGAQAGATQPAAGATTAAGATGGELTAVIDGFARVRSYRMTVVVEAPGAPAQQITIAAVLPDRFQMTIGSPAGAFEVITIGQDSYVKLGPTWTKQAVPGGQVFDVSSVSASVRAFQTGGVKGGTATVGGKTCQIYTTTGPAGTNEVCVADNLPLRIVSQSGPVKTTITFTDYNANIDIRAPI